MALDLEEAHRKLKEKQDALEPYLTFQMMLETLGYKSYASVQYVLAKLIDLGMVEVIQFGENIKRYRIK